MARQLTLAGQIRRAAREAYFGPGFNLNHASKSQVATARRLGLLPNNNPNRSASKVGLFGGSNAPGLVDPGVHDQGGGGHAQPMAVPGLDLSAITAQFAGGGKTPFHNPGKPAAPPTGVVDQSRVGRIRKAPSGGVRDQSLPGTTGPIRRGGHGDPATQVWSLFKNSADLIRQAPELARAMGLIR